jgi:site-specific DNA-methyltransferase (adenine-specific)
MELKTNVLYYGDNLDILRKYIPDESIDLIYLDPPFNSQATYNVLFRESSGVGSEAQIEAFGDTWHWGPAAQEAYEEVMTGPHQRVARMLRAMVDGLGHNDVMAYLVMMAIRLVELHRVLNPTGSIYLHCDPTAGHYLKVLMDTVFGPRNFLSDIIRVRGNPGGRTAMSKRFGTNHDFILMYAKQRGLHRFVPQTRQQRDEYIRTHYRRSDERGIFQDVRLQNPSPERLKELEAAGLIYYTKTGTPRLKRYLEEAQVEGSVVDAIWGERGLDEEAKIRDLNSQARERLSYPTQKPLALLERIVSASSNPGDIVLDPFCGCGTAVHAAHKLGRRWIGIDITHLAIGLIRRRMQDAFQGIAIEVIGEPVDLAGARDLAQRDKYQFQWWALDRLGAQPVSGKKKGADKGIDGVIPFFAGPKEDYKRVIVSVKGGEHVNVAMVRDLKGVLEREREPIAVLLALAPPTKEMVTEAAAAGFYESGFWERKFPRVQIVTVEEILGGKRPDIPWGKAPFAKAPLEKEKGEQGEML